MNLKDNMTKILYQGDSINLNNMKKNLEHITHFFLYKNNWEKILANYVNCFSGLYQEI